MAPFLRGLDALGVNDGGRRRRFTSLLHAHLLAQGVMHSLPQSVFLPAPEVAVDGVPGGQVVGQKPPGTAGAQLVENGVEYFSVGIRTRTTCSAAGLRLGQMGFEFLILSVG